MFFVTGSVHWAFNEVAITKYYLCVIFHYFGSISSLRACLCLSMLFMLFWCLCACLKCLVIRMFVESIYLNYCLILLTEI